MMTRPAPTRLPVRPGPTGVADVAEAVRRMLAGFAAPFAVYPAVESGTPGQRFSAQYAAAVHADAPVEHDDVALVMPTSGSTGEARGVLLSAAAIRWAAETGAAALGRPGLWLTAVPVTGIGGLLTVARSLLAGHPPIVWPGVGGAGAFTAASFATSARQCLDEAVGLGVPAYVSLVPTQLGRILADPDATAALAGFGGVLVGGAPFPAWMHEQALAAGVAVVETYGATETCGGIVYGGVPLPGAAIRLDDGSGNRISLQSPSLALGYRLRPDLTAKAFVDGWFHSEDSGELVDGRLVVSDRLDNIVKVGGHKVSLNAIATVVRGHPRVIAAVAAAEPDHEWGHIPVVYVVPDESSLTSTDFDRAHLAERIGAAVADRLGRAARPRRIEFVADLPTTASGKPLAPGSRA